MRLWITIIIKNDSPQSLKGSDRAADGKVNQVSDTRVLVNF